MGRKENNFQFKSGFIQKFSPEDQSGDHISLNAYHYTSPEAFLSIIQNHSIRFTDIRYMNDRAEGIYFVKLLLDFVEKNRGNYPHFEEVTLTPKELFSNIQNLSQSRNSASSLRCQKQRSRVRKMIPKNMLESTTKNYGKVFAQSTA